MLWTKIIIRNVCGFNSPAHTISVYVYVNIETARASSHTDTHILYNNNEYKILCYCISELTSAYLCDGIKN